MTGNAISAAVLAGALGAICAAGTVRAQTVDDILEAELRRTESAQQAQDQIDQIASTTRSRFDDYQRLLRDIDGLNVYNRMMQARVDDQNRTLAELRQSIDEVSVFERQVLPLMQRMIDGLQSYISADAPFLVEERLARVERLRRLLRRSDVSTAEQFRNVIEAWQIENEYGYTSEVYTDHVEIDGRQREVEMLRIGRIGLLYVTPNRGLAGMWNHTTRSWDDVPLNLIDQISYGIDIVETDVPPDMFMIPVLPPEEG